MAENTLSQQLAEQIGAADSKVIPKIFESLIDDSEAKLLLAASPPATAQELSERTGLEPARIEAMIDRLFGKGLLFKSRKPDAVRYYRVRHLMQFHDATAVLHDPPEGMLDLWKEYMASEWNEFGKKLDASLPRSPTRVIPVNESVEPTGQVLAFDDVTGLVNDARNLAVTKCSCRAIDGRCGKPVDVCLQLDRAADYAIERGTGRQLTKEEAIQILRQCAADGLVHITENKRALGQVICNCCSDCCINWMSIQPGMGKFVAPSRFRATVEEEACDGCELCVERCLFDALHMDEAGELALIDGEKCMGCGVCHVVCPTDAISMQVARGEEFVPA